MLWFDEESPETNFKAKFAVAIFPNTNSQNR